MSAPSVTNNAGARLGPLGVLHGLLLKPSPTMWGLREAGPLWLSFAAAAALGGLGYTNSHWLERLAGHSQPLWACWLVGLLLAPVALVVSMALTHVAALIVYRAGEQPIFGGSFRALLRLGGYAALPTVAAAGLQNGLVLLAVRTRSVEAARAIYLGMIPIALAALVWALVFRLRLLRTVYLVGWGPAAAIMVIASVMSWAIFGTTSAPLIGVTPASVGWDLHLALGADPTVIEVVESLPQARSEGSSAGAYAYMMIVPIRGGPVVGDRVAYYTDWEPPPLRRGTRLPSGIQIGTVVGVHGDSASRTQSTSTVMIEPVGANVGAPAAAVPIPERNIAGIAVAPALWLHRLIARLTN